MKKNFVKICTVMLGFTLVACLDDDKYALAPGGDTENVIEFTDPSVPNSPSGAVYPLWTTVTEVQESFTFEQTITYAGAEDEAPRDIDLVVEVDPSVLAEYNEQMETVLFGDTYNMMPANYYDFPAVEVTIPKGKKTATISITVKPDQFDLSKSFAIPLRITSASSGVLSKHFSAAVFAVVVKNIYDGVYTVEDGNIQRNSATGPDPALSGDMVIGLEIGFTTVNGVTTAFQPTWKDGSGIAGIDATKVTVNPAVTYTAPAGFESWVPATGTANPATMSSSNPVLQNTAGRPNFFWWDGTTNDKKTFVLNFAWGASPSTRVITDYKLEWDHVR